MVEPNCIFCVPGWWAVQKTALWIVRPVCGCFANYIGVIFHIWDCRGWLVVESTMGNGISISRFIAFWKVLVLIIKLLELLTPIAKWDRLSWLTQDLSTSHWPDSNPVCYSHSLDLNLVRGALYIFQRELTPGALCWWSSLGAHTSWKTCFGA